MALGGTYIDNYLELFKGIVDHEAQQKGSLLDIVAKKEMVKGNKNYFTKLGKVNHYLKTSRGQAKNRSDLTFEKRLIDEQFVSFDHLLDVEDLIRYVDNPSNEVIAAAVYAMGRQKDEIIFNAISGNASVIENGVTSSQALTLSVIVNDHSYDTGSGDVALTPSKLKEAVRLLRQNYGYNGMEKLFCIAPMGQLMNLTMDDEVISKDFRFNPGVIERPGVVAGLDGYLGMTFIAYEDTGVDGNADELVYVVTEDAVKLGIFQDTKVEMMKNPSYVGNPDELSITQALGAVRMFEEKVVKIACDPRKS